MTDAVERVSRDRAEAFALLASVVRENHEVGRRSYAASVKPELRRRTYDGFDEGRLQFGSFRAFLAAAKEAGVVDVYAATRGPDLELTPPGGRRLSDPTPVRTGKRVRHDLWECFLRWDDGWSRVFDRVENAALRFPIDPAPLEPPRLTEIRAAAAAHPDRFLPIDPISFDTQAGWMRRFAEGVDTEDAKPALLWALDSDRPFRAFSRALETMPDLRTTWAAARQGLVEAVIVEWAHRNDLDLDQFGLHEEPPLGGPPVADHEQPSSRTGPPADERLRRLRAIVHAAIDEMPESDLLQIRLPVGYLLDR